MKKQILVVDDSPAIHPLVKAILASEPVEIHHAMDANYGLTLAASLRPDLILLDVDMPDMDGFATAQQLKADPETAGCAIIFLTARANPQEKVRAFGLGAVDYVTKPFNASELLARVRSSLRTQNAIRSLEEQSLTDPLTGLGNRAMFDQRLCAEVALRIRFAYPLSIIMIDIDQFKQVNDTHGHLVGDKVLQKIGEIINGLCRVEDVACRLGGDEFAIIASHTSGRDAEILASRIQKILAGSRIKLDGATSRTVPEEGIAVTVSLGIAAANDSYDRSMLERADFAMYRAKQAGRNRVFTAQPDKLAHQIAA